jgi:HflK protein
LTIIAPDEIGVVRRFGNPVADLEPGWYWRYPWPVEDTLRVSQRVRTVSIGFREPTDAIKETGAMTWSSAHRKEARIANEAMMITGDGDLVDVMVTVRFRVTQPRVYLFQVSNADEIIRGITESELRAMVAGRPFLELLTLQRERFHDDALQRVRARCLQLSSDGLGVDIDGISIIDLHPPAEVVDSYYKVAQAMEERDTRINEAIEQATRMTETNKAKVNEILALARAAQAEKIQEADRDRQRFEALFKPRKDHPGLVDFRLYWDSVAKALSGRELILIDTDKVVGRRNLMLFDPEQFRVPLPIIVRPDPELRQPLRPKDDH